MTPNPKIPMTKKQVKNALKEINSAEITSKLTGKLYCYVDLGYILSLLPKKKECICGDKTMWCDCECDTWNAALKQVEKNLRKGMVKRG